MLQAVIEIYLLSAAAGFAIVVALAVTGLELRPGASVGLVFGAFFLGLTVWLADLTLRVFLS